MEFAAELKRIAEGIPYQKVNARNEQQTIEGLIRPFIVALGYDLGNPLETPAQNTCCDGSRVDFPSCTRANRSLFSNASPRSTNDLLMTAGNFEDIFMQPNR